MRGIGNYSGPRQPVAAPQQERRIGTLAVFQGDRAIVRFPGALAYAMPAHLFKSAGVAAGGHFAMVVTRDGQRVVDIRIEPHAEARQTLEGKALPKVYVRMDGKFSTRK